MLNTGIIAIGCYFVATILAVLNKPKFILLTTLLGLTLHFLVLWDLVVINWINLGFFHALSFASWFMLLSLLLTYRWYSLTNMLVIILPIATITLSLELLYPNISQQQPNAYLDTHILLSILAYSFLAIATLLAIFLFVQEKLLKTKRLTGLIQKLPPLSQIETALFKTLWLGYILLSCSLLSGWLFMDDIFAQHLSHKTFFSILSWLIFTILLFGRITYGWRGIIATKFTLIGFILVLLAYFGSKMVQELLLD